MMIGKLGTLIHERFSVVNSSKNLVSGIDPSEFIISIIDPLGNISSVTHSINELSLAGHYSLNFTPNQVGIWYVDVKHPVHFPWGKTDDIQVFKNDLDSIGDMVVRILGLSQENYFLDNLVFNANSLMTNGRIRTYTHSTSVGTNSDILSTYDITASYDPDGKMESYSVMKI